MASERVGQLGEQVLKDRRVDFAEAGVVAEDDGRRAAEVNVGVVALEVDDEIVEGEACPHVHRDVADDHAVPIRGDHGEVCDVEGQL